MASTLEKVKISLRRSHSKLDEDLQDEIDACLADLRVCGVVYAGEEDPLVLNAVKLWCKSLNIDDTAKAAEYRQRYDALKSCLMSAEGYGRPMDEEAAADG
jgi:hypothetical protein